MFLTATYTCYRHKPWPLQGGRKGRSHYLEVLRAEGSREEFAVATEVQINSGDVIRIHANGAGYGDPRRRATRKSSRIADWASHAPAGP
jgi:N-methylhydantoinase B